MTATQLLRERERRFDTLIASLPGVAYRCRNDEPYGTEFVSEGVAELTGYPAADFLAQRRQFGELVHPDDQAAVWQEIQRALERGTPFELQYRILDSRGTEKWVWERGHGVRDARGEVVALEGFVTDITARVRQSAALGESEERLRLALGAARMGIYDWDMASGRIVWSSGHEAIWGFAPGEFGGTYGECAARVHPADLPGLERELARCRAARQPFEREFRVVWADASEHWVHARGEFAFAPDGEAFRMRGVVMDVTARRAAQDALAERERLLAAVIDTEPECVKLVDAQGRLVQMNPAGLAMLEAGSLEEARARPLGGFVLPAHRAGFQSLLRRVLRGESGTLEFELEGLRGTRRWLETHAAPLRGADGKVALLLGITRDVTQRRRDAEEREAAAARLRQLSRRLVEIEETERRAISGELHDRIGQTLATLGLNLNVLQASLPPDATAGVLARLRDAQVLVDAAARQARDLMAELHPPALEDFGLAAALRVHAEQLAARTGMCIEVAGGEPAPRLAPAVELALFRIAQEALANAAKHARATRVAVSLAASPREVSLAIADDGAGFDAARPRRGGRSWGLGIMADRAQAAGLSLAIDSAPGKGTRVTALAPREAA